MEPQERLEAFKAAVQKVEQEFGFTLVATLKNEVTGITPCLQAIDKQKDEPK